MSDQKIKYGTVELDADEFNATHSDQELRNKLASDLSEICFCAGPTCSGCESNTQKIFKAGWDAARANEHKIILKPETGGTYTVHAKLTTTAEVERDQLREQLQWSLRNEEKYKAALNESFKRETELRAQCEKLAEALEQIRSGLTTDKSRVEVLTKDLASKALTEYREKFKK